MERKGRNRQGRKGKLKTEVEKTEREMKMGIFRMRRDKEKQYKRSLQFREKKMDILIQVKFLIFSPYPHWYY